MVDPKTVPGELRPQLPHRDRLIKNETYERVIKEINDYFDDWAVTKLSSVDIKVMPGRGKYEKIANQLEKEFTPDLIPGALVMKAREHFYTKQTVAYAGISRDQLGGRFWVC